MKLAGAALCLLIGGAPGAALADPRPLALDEAVAAAVQHGAALRVAQAQYARAGALAAEARSAFLPQVEASFQRANESVNLTTFGFSLPGQPPVVGPFDVVDGQVTASLRLFDLASLRRYQALRQAQAAGGFAAQAAENDIVFAAARLYVLLREAETQVATHDANVALFTELRRAAQDRFEAGTATRLDVTRADVQLARERQAVIAATARREDARLSLLRAMGADLRTDVRTVEPTVANALPDPEQALASAVAARPELRQVDALLRQAQLAGRAASAGRLPTLEADAGGDYAGNSLDELHWSRRITAALHVPVFDGGRVSARVAQARAALDEATARRDDVRAQVEQEVRGGVLQLASARARAEVALQAVDLAEQELQVARERLENGFGSSLDVDRAQDAWRQAKDDRDTARAEAALADVALARATGAIRGLVPPAAARP